MVTKKLCKAKISKRKTTRQRKGIERKIKQGRKKVKKQIKKFKAMGVYCKRKSKKELKVPNLCPFKKALLEQLKRKKEGASKLAELEGKNIETTRNDMLT